MIDGGRPFELFDVRTEDERAMAMIEGSRLLDQKGYNYLLTLDRDTPVVFQCHHGIRSQSAAEHCLREQGFRNLYNLAGGIDAWSLLSTRRCAVLSRRGIRRSRVRVRLQPGLRKPEYDRT